MNVIQPNNYNNQPNQAPPQQEYYEDEDDVEEQQYPQYMNPYARAVYPSQDASFLKWLFSFRKEAVEPLRHVWRGEEFDFESHTWLPNEVIINGKRQLIHTPIMNEKGINWGISFIESFMSPTFIVTELDERTYNFRMRTVIRVIWNSLCKRWEEFGIKDKTDIPRIAEEIESKVCAILRGSLNDGYRDFFSTQNQNIETRNLSNTEPQRRPGIFSSMAGMFRKSNQQQYQ
jgi:hypothetical protein